MSGTLYLVGTPIGNLEDFSPRAIRTLKEVDWIAAEDTRVTRKLCNHFEIHTPLLSYHSQNAWQRKEQILTHLLDGESGALVSDAGMPCVSDPGEELVALCAQHDIAVCTVPGPCAAIAALSLSGLSTARFRFEGFLSVNRLNRKKRLSLLQNEMATLLFYEAPHKLCNTLSDLLQALGDRKITLVKEMTKIHETVHRTTLSQAVDWYRQNLPKGEYVLVVAGKDGEEEEMTFTDALRLAHQLLTKGMRVSDAAKQAAALSGFSKSSLYKELVDFSKEISE